MLGDNVPVAAGIGMSFKMRREDRVDLLLAMEQPR
jgi:hypothetical protein